MEPAWNNVQPKGKAKRQDLRTCYNLWFCFFFSVILIRCDLEKLKRQKVHLMLPNMCLNSILSIKDKQTIIIISGLKEGQKGTDLVLEFGISKQQISDIRKNKD